MLSPRSSKASVDYARCGTLEIAVAAAAAMRDSRQAQNRSSCSRRPVRRSTSIASFEARGNHFRDIVIALPGIESRGRRCLMRFDREDNSLLVEWWFTVDRLLLTAVLVLIGVGIVVSLAASPSVALNKDLAAFYFVKRHVVIVAVSAFC